MTRDEAYDIVAMILSYWRVRDWSKEEIDAFANGIMSLPAELTTSAVVRASKELTWPPKLNELHEFVGQERRRLAPTVTAVVQKPKPMEMWVRRWICARFLWERFGKSEPDFRRFAEQKLEGDQTQELMPEGAWEKEAAILTEGQLMSAFVGARQSMVPKRRGRAPGAGAR